MRLVATLLGVKKLVFLWTEPLDKLIRYDEWKSKHKMGQLQEGQAEPSDVQLPHNHRK